MVELLGATLTVIVSYKIASAAGLLTMFFIGVILAVIAIAVRSK
jgi:hypothetical protein